VSGRKRRHAKRRGTERIRRECAPLASVFHVHGEHNAHDPAAKSFEPTLHRGAADVSVVKEQYATASIGGSE
jgi:hypothetical protein